MTPLYAVIVSDPSTAKSQFLKFAVQVAPIGVYTSGEGSTLYETLRRVALVACVLIDHCQLAQCEGCVVLNAGKGSSAAGLTASVIRDPSTGMTCMQYVCARSY